MSEGKNPDSEAAEPVRADSAPSSPGPATTPGAEPGSAAGSAEATPVAAPPAVSLAARTLVRSDEHAPEPARKVADTPGTGAAAAPAAPAPTTSGPNAPIPPPKVPAEKRRATPAARIEEAPLSLPTKLMLALLAPIGFVLRPFGYFFRIREPLPIALRTTLPLVLVVATLAFWQWATAGEHYLGSFERLSPLDERKAELEKAIGVPIRLVTRDKEEKSWTSREKKLVSEVVGITLPKVDFDAHKAAIEKLLGADQYDVKPSPDGAVTLEAKSHFGKREAESELTKTKKKLEAIVPGIALETRDVIDSKGNPRTIIARALVPEAAATNTATLAALERIFGDESFAPGDREGDRVPLVGREQIETRRINPSTLPSPHEMIDSLPSLVNARWKTWADIAHWWKVGEPEGAGTGPPSTPKKLELDWNKWNDIPFRLVDAFFERSIGANWTKDWILLHAAVWSSLRIFMGFAYAALIAVPLGLLMGSFSKHRYFFEPVRLIGSYVPLPALCSLTIVWWGISESQKVGFLAICTFVVLLPQVVMAVEAIPQAHVDAARTLGASRWQQMRYVLLSGAKAEIMRSLRLSFAVGWTWIILVEVLNAETGLGYLIFLGERRSEHRPHIYAVIVLIVLIAFVTNSTWAWVERKLFPYREED